MKREGDGLELVYAVAPFAEYQLEASEDLVDWEILDSPHNPLKTLPEGETQIETKISATPENGVPRFVRVKATER